MIVVLVVLGALALLIAGLVWDDHSLAFAALGLCILALILSYVADIRVWLARWVAAGKPSRDHDSDSAEQVRESATVAVEDSMADAEEDVSSEVSAAVVFVVRGRKRFHQAGCRTLRDDDSEELTLGEARDEGFTPCTVCALGEKV